MLTPSLLAYLVSGRGTWVRTEEPGDAAESID
jgi:hypothetical protein